jgi:hypothetical protein
MNKKMVTIDSVPCEPILLDGHIIMNEHMLEQVRSYSNLGESCL